MPFKAIWKAEAFFSLTEFLFVWNDILCYRKVTRETGEKNTSTLRDVENQDMPTNPDTNSQKFIML